MPYKTITRKVVLNTNREEVVKAKIFQRARLKLIQKFPVG